MDRLSRENPWDAVPLLCQIVNAGIDVVTLLPSEMVYTRAGDLTGLILAVVEFGRGHSESKTKSDRNTQKWSERKRLAREAGQVITSSLPAWLEVVKGKVVPIPSRVEVVRRIFSLAISGHGVYLIVKTLTSDGVPAFDRSPSVRRVKRREGGRKATWSRAYVRRILTRRAVLGEHQPMKADEPDGDPLRGYYPAVIEEKTWERAQHALKSRHTKGGRGGRGVASVFTGLLRDARGGGKMRIKWHGTGSGPRQNKRHQVLLASDAEEGNGAWVSFPYPTFEAAVLKCLAEVKAADVTGAASAPESAGLAVEARALEVRLRAVREELEGDGGDVPTLAKAARTLDARLQDVLRRLKEAQHKEANPASAALAEAQSLIDAAADEGNRLRLRSLLATLAESIHVLIVPVPERTVRLCAVQIDFHGGRRRSYLIRYQQAKGNQNMRQESSWEVRSLSEESPGADALDLRDPEQARQLAEDLAEVELEG